MPIFSEDEWDKLQNNISVAAFMQGIPIGSKYYNNYCIITNNKNKELVNKESIYMITNDNVVHRAASNDVVEKQKDVVIGYKNIDFEMQTVVINEENELYYYPHDNEKCYECMVNIGTIYDIDDIINGAIKVYDKKTDTYNLDTTKNITNLRKIYLTALARERYNLYQVNY